MFSPENLKYIRLKINRLWYYRVTDLSCYLTHACAANLKYSIEIIYNMMIKYSLWNIIRYTLKRASKRLCHRCRSKRLIKICESCLFFFFLRKSPHRRNTAYYRIIIFTVIGRYTHYTQYCAYVSLYKSLTKYGSCEAEIFLYVFPLWENIIFSSIYFLRGKFHFCFKKSIYFIFIMI